MTAYHVNSLFWWYPIVEGLVPTPRTSMIDYEGNTLQPESKEWQDFIAEVREVIDAEYQLPVFIRCGGLAGKHEWNDTCYLDDINKLSQQAHNIMQCVLMVMGIRLDYDGIAVREFLELESRFTGFGRNKMPIAKEFRFFARDGQYECHHPYWPPTSLWGPSVDNWYEELKEMQQLSDEELEQLKGYCHLISTALDSKEHPLGTGWWSLDFCKTVDGEWYLTDLATGFESYHWVSCPHSPKHQKEQYPDPEDPEKLAEVEGPTARAASIKAMKEKYAKLKDEA